MEADDLILISVDDHIAEPPTCLRPTYRWPSRNTPRG